MSKPERYEAPQQVLLDFAQELWGQQFSEGGQQNWWAWTTFDGYDAGRYAGVTDGKDYYLMDEDEDGIRRLVIDEQEFLEGITTKFRSIKEAKEAQAIPF